MFLKTIIWNKICHLTVQDSLQALLAGRVAWPSPETSDLAASFSAACWGHTRAPASSTGTSDDSLGPVTVCLLPLSLLPVSAYKLVTDTNSFEADL